MDIAKTIRLPAGRYVVAVSGGVDSMALLDLLRNRPGVKLTVAHFDHGIRDDSAEDRKLIQDVTRRHKLPFVYDRARLGKDASEATARAARYAFLHKVRAQSDARAIITAHHLDDAVETAIHNMLRGTGRKGMSSLHGAHPGHGPVIRPLLHLPKSQLRSYAEKQGLEWREDSTNADLKYRRNYIRHKLIPRLKNESPKQYAKLVRLIKRQVELNRAIDEQLTHLMHLQPQAGALDRHGLIMLPHNLSKEVVAHWLRLNGRGQFQKPQLERLTRGLKTGRVGSRLVIGPKHYFYISKDRVDLHSM